MEKIEFEVKVPITVFKDGDCFVADSPLLDLSSYGDTFEEAKKNFAEAAEILLEELADAGTLNQYLFDLGWKKSKRGWSPPVVVAHEFACVEMSLNGRR